jgi:hypothetical protein
LKYEGADTIFSTLPKEITNVLLEKLQDFLSFDFTEIAKFDTFDIPNGIQLFDPIEEEINKNNQIIDADMDENITKRSAKFNENRISAEKSTIPPLADEFFDDDFNDLSQVPHLNDHRRDIADDLAQLYKDDPAQDPANAEVPTP